MITLNPRVHESINEGLLYFADPKNGIAGQLLDGSNKCLVIRTKHFPPEPKFELLRPGDKGFDVPNFIWTALQMNDLNIRAGVPLWVYGYHKGQHHVVGTGVYHPLTTSATIHMLFKGHCWDTIYFSDPRLSELAASELVDEDNVRNARLKGLIKIEPMCDFEYQTLADLEVPLDIPKTTWGYRLPKIMEMYRKAKEKK